MNLPQIIGKGVDGDLAELEGWHRLKESQHRQRLMLAHAYGRHREVIEGCPECAQDWALFLAHVINRPRDVMEFFR